MHVVISLIVTGSPPTCRNENSLGSCRREDKNKNFQGDNTIEFAEKNPKYSEICLLFQKMMNNITCYKCSSSTFPSRVENVIQQEFQIMKELIHIWLAIRIQNV